jgi:DNA polymerase I-like protein with 3'-5' exonuclease and polymerase domains
MPLVKQSEVQNIINRINASKTIVFDLETTGLNFKTNKICGHGLAFSPNPNDAHYIPVRHATGNLENISFEPELIRALDRQDLTVIMHNAHFDLRFLYEAGSNLSAKYIDTMINAALLDEYSPRFSLEYLAVVAGLTPKKSDMIKSYIRSKFPDVTKNEMGHYWRLAGDDPNTVEYACGDNTTTFELWEHQYKQLSKDDIDPITGKIELHPITKKPFNLLKVFKVECRLLPVLARMSAQGIKVDEEYLHKLKNYVEVQIYELEKQFPEGFNSRAPTEMRKLFEVNGITDWPLSPTGQPSFNSMFLEKSELGQKVIALRKLLTLKSMFIEPLINDHIIDGRVHTTFNQLRGDGFGVVTGRISTQNPGMGQVPKRDKLCGPLFRAVFIPDNGKVWGDADWSQCLAKGTKIIVPGGYKNIEDIKVGDWVYSYTEDKNLTLKKVLWAGCTGKKKVVKLTWKTYQNNFGELIASKDHKIRLKNGEYKEIGQLIGKITSHRSPYVYNISVMALRRQTAVNWQRSFDARNYLHLDGYKRVKEARFVFEQVYGYSPEEVHHIDGDSLNDVPSNLEGLTKKEHSKITGGKAKKSAQEIRLNKFNREKLALLFSESTKQHHIRKALNISQFTLAMLIQEFNLFEESKHIKGITKLLSNCSNHLIIDIEPLEIEQEVYDITVEDTHNFIANEICVHNCEPRLLAYYSRSKLLLTDYRTNPNADSHQAVADAAGIERHWGKHANMTIINSGGRNVLINKYHVPEDKVDELLRKYFEVMPEVKRLQINAAAKFKARGFVRSLLGRKARLANPGKSYTAVNRLLQVGNADCLKLKLVEIDEYLESEGRPVDILNTVHDSISFQFEPEHLEIYEECLKIMNDFGKGHEIELDVPFKCDSDIGENWATATYGEEVVPLIKEVKNLKPVNITGKIYEDLIGEE